MTVMEAKKIIAMCTDTIHSDDGTKTYVNEEYVMSILDMIGEPKTNHQNIYTIKQPIDQYASVTSANKK